MPEIEKLHENLHYPITRAAIIGLKNPFDCAGYLCEFKADNKLRLLPKGSHAFYLECIEMWLLSHSTCPLCNCPTTPPPMSDQCESSREIYLDRDTVVVAPTAENTQLSFRRDCIVDGKRCFSMGSFKYVMDNTSQLQVAIKPQAGKQGTKKQN
ncbi:hypothetical protein ACLOJK_010191 [Asimina triloba]